MYKKHQVNIASCSALTVFTVAVLESLPWSPLCTRGPLRLESCLVLPVTGLHTVPGIVLKQNNHQVLLLSVYSVQDTGASLCIKSICLTPFTTKDLSLTEKRLHSH